MKTKIKVLALACLILLVPASGFALFDISVYGGFPFSGEYDTLKQKIHTDNHAYGASVHWNTGFLALFQLGLGGYYQFSAVRYKVDGGSDFTLDRNTMGIEGVVLLDVPFLPFHPYVKLNTAAWNKVKDKDGNISKTENLKKHGIGAGLAITFLPLPGLVSFQLFGEYMYNFGKEDGDKVKQSYAFLGIRADIF